MIDSCRSAVGFVAALMLAALAGCARDGTLEPRTSLKDTPEPGYATPRTRAAAAPHAASEYPVSKRMTAVAAPERERERTIATARVEAPAPAPRPQVEAPQVPPAAVPPPPQRTSSNQPVATPAMPKAPAPFPERKPSGSQLLEEGRNLFRSGEVLAARERYVAALNAPLPEVLLELARTYDPNYLDKLPKSDADADVERARALYEQSMALGSTLAEADMARLKASSGKAR